VGEGLLQVAVDFADGIGHRALGRAAGDIERVADAHGLAVAEIVLAFPVFQFVGLERRQRVRGMEISEQQQPEAEKVFHGRKLAVRPRDKNLKTLPGRASPFQATWPEAALARQRSISWINWRISAGVTGAGSSWAKCRQASS
jgi:hypothetical protein